jgi:hypothetical protein
MKLADDAVVRAGTGTDIDRTGGGRFDSERTRNGEDERGRANGEPAGKF